VIKKNFWKTLLVISAIVLCISSATGQVKDHKRFSRLKVSEDLQKRLAERFNQFFEYELTQQYEKQWDLIVNEQTKEPHPLYFDKTSYVEFKKKINEIHGLLLELKVTGIDKKLDKNNRIGITVKGKFYKNKNFYDEPYVGLGAYLQNGEWFFSMAYFQV
jgi:hypothetical protein